ncbi:MAG: hypothetical protein AUH29_08845 [Candidatus Rokubacteria bacterium 13_1_40CM_69_27]|nr:MAG: hypothetical protein AUH29_08845 [Candidatus Rokubacteria bacterium 13_1_40CM_69_27]OLC30096.1 MAG: hypothetical protein AUH81_20800 [Candidatus Rokubacteria bacterium 13_1_40CM_4_69_5]OLE37409.1 MAG: hypothetical protein AUG00_08285 [Candidatus Rokubacteria bacterium 13_1_20CM_2_70_7]
MPATIEALLIILVFVMPGFITVRMKETLVPTIGKTETFEVTLRSITVSLLYLPLWLLSAKDLVLFRGRLMDVAQKTSSGESLILDRGVVVFLALSLVLPAAIGVIWAVAYCNDWYVKATKRAYVKLGIPLPPSGIGEDLWDRLWLNRDRQPWLTVFMKDGRMYVGRGIEFSLSSYGKDVLLGPETRMYDKEGRLARDLAESRGEGVWIPAGEVSSIDIHE